MVRLFSVSGVNSPEGDTVLGPDVSAVLGEAASDVISDNDVFFSLVTSVVDIEVVVIEVDIVVVLGVLEDVVMVFKVVDCVVGAKVDTVVLTVVESVFGVEDLVLKVVGLVVLMKAFVVAVDGLVVDTGVCLVGLVPLGVVLVGLVTA